MKIICRSREYTVALICFTVVFLFADQNLLAPNLSLIAREFHFSNAQRDDLLGAKIALGFFVIGGVVSLVVGYLTDSVCRIPLFSFIVLLGEMACLLTNWTKTYLQLYICRVLTGISIGGATPVVFSLLADFYPNNSRVKISTFIGISMSCGIAFGQLLAGVVGPTAGWRLPFVLVAVPAILFAILIFFTGIEPKRGGQEEAVRSLRRNKRSAMAAVVTTQPVESIYSPMWRRAIGYYWKTKYSNMEQNSSELEQLSPPATADVFDPATEESETPSCNESGIEYSERADFKKALGLLQNRSALIVFLQGVPACLPWGMVYTFLNDYLSNDRGQTVMQATLALTCFGIGGFFGQVAGGAAGQQLYNRDKRLQCVLMGGSTMIATFPMLFLINNTRAGTGFFFMAALSGFVVSMNGPNVRAVLQVHILPLFSINAMTNNNNNICCLF